MEIYGYRRAIFRRVHKLRKATISFVMSVCPSAHLSAWNNFAPTGRIFMKFVIRGFFSKIYQESSSFINIGQE